MEELLVNLFLIEVALDNMAKALAASFNTAIESFNKFSQAWSSAIAKEIASHPDLAELNIILDSYYKQEETK